MRIVHGASGSEQVMPPYYFSGKDNSLVDISAKELDDVTPNAVISHVSSQPPKSTIWVEYVQMGSHA